MDAARQLAQLLQRARPARRARRRACRRGRVRAVSSRRLASPSCSESATRRCWAPSCRSRSRRRRSNIDDLHQPRARGLQLVEARAQLGLQALVLQRQRGRGGHRAHEPGLVGQRGVVDDRADADALALDLGHRAARARLGQLDRAPVVGDVVAGRRAPVDELERAVAERVGQRDPSERSASGLLRRSISSPTAPARE